MELFKKDGSQYWWYDFTLPGVPRQRGSTKQTNETRATRVAAAKLADAMAGNYDLRKRVPTLSKHWEWFKGTNLFTSLDPDTQRYYRNGWRMVKDTPLAKMRVTGVRNIDVLAVTISGSPSNVNNARRTVRRLLNLAVEAGIMPKCPAVQLLEENERHVLLDEETEAAILPHSPQPLEDIIKLMRDGGFRNQLELYPMRIENIDWEGKRYVVPDSKSPEGRREVHLSDRAMDILKRRCEGRTQGWVFPSVRKGKHITGGLVNKQWVKARRAARLPESLVLYSGRHDCGTTLMEETGDIKLVMVSLGHRDTKATIRYTRPRPSRMREVINARRKKAAVLEFKAQSAAQR